MGKEEPWLRVHELTVRLNKEYIFRDESFEIRGPGLVMVLGPNGAGKTTLFRAILGLIPIERGKVIIMGEDVTGKPELAGKYVGYVPQLNNMLRSFPITARELIETSLGIERMIPWKNRDVTKEPDKCLKIIEASRYADEPITELSGGQLQRVLIARALVKKPYILFMDEPISALDPKGKERIVRLIEEISKERLVLVSTHDPAVFVNSAKEIMLVNKGIKAIGSTREIFKLETLKEVYGDSILLIEKCLHVI